MKSERRKLQWIARAKAIFARGLVSAFAAMLMAACGTATPTLDQGEAYERIYIAVFYKEAECGGRPDFPIFFLDDPSSFGVDACAFAIIRGDCPFTQYPLICLEAFNTDVPNIGPDLSLPDLQL